jgi:hypothetical protein
MSDHMFGQMFDHMFNYSMLRPAILSATRTLPAHPPAAVTASLAYHRQTGFKRTEQKISEFCLLAAISEAHQILSYETQT